VRLREGRVEYSLDRKLQSGIKFVIALVYRQPLGEGARETGDDAVVGGQALVCLAK
jgi:hypothetical protein